MKNRSSLLSNFGAIIILITGSMVIAGWYLRSDFLRTLVPGQVAMKFNTALCFVLSAIVLLIHNSVAERKRQHPVVTLLAVLITLISLATLFEFITAIDLGIDEIFVKDDRRTSADYFAGRMSPLTAINFLFTGSGFLLLNREKTAVYQFFYLFAIAFFSMLMLIGFNFITAIPTYFYLAVHTAIGFVILSGAIWFAQPSLKNKIRFEWKLFTGFCAVMLLISVLSIFSYYFSKRRVSTSNMVKHTYNVLTEARQVLSLVKDIESGGRGYVITHDSSYLSYLLLAKENVINHLNKLKQLTADNGLQQARIDLLSNAVRKRLDLSEQIISLRNKKGQKAAIDLITTQQGIFYTEEIRQLVAVIEKEENELLMKRQQANTRNIDSFNRAFIAFLIVVFLLLFIILLWIRNYINIGKQTAAILNKQKEVLEQRVKERVTEIEKNEQRFRAVIENNFDIITLLDKDFKIFYRSPSAVRIMGWTNEELMGHDGIKNIHPDDREKTTAIISPVHNTPGLTVHVMFRNRHKDGHYLWVEGTIINLLHDENVQAYVFNFRDISARVEGEAKLIASEERFRSIIEQYPSPVIRYTPNGSLISANPAWEAMWQDKLENTIGYNILKDPQMKAAGMLDKIERAFAGETVMTDVQQYDPALTGKTGRKRWIQLLMYPLKDHEGRLLEVIVITIDMTGNKEAEEKLVESEKQYRYLFQNNPMPMWVIDLKTFRFLDVNKMAILQYGYSRQEFLAMTAIDIRPEEEKAAFIQLDHSFKTYDGNFNKGIWRHQKKDGTIIQVEIIAHEILFEGIEARLVLANDVTEQKKAEEKIVASEKQFRQTLDNMLEGAQIIDFNWRYIYVNDSLTKQAKYKKEEMIGFTMMEKYPGIEKTELFKVFQRCFSDRISIHLENEFNYPDGSVGWFELSFQPVPAGVFVLSIDITERKKAQVALQRAETNYREIFEKAGDAINILHIETGRILELNQRAAEITGYSKETLINEDNVLLSTGNPDYSPLIFKAYLQKASDGQPQQFDWLIKKADGSESWIEINLAKANIAGEERILSFFREVNDRKRAQLEVQKLNEELEHKVTVRTEQLKKTNDELEAFSYSVSHDLRAPLRAIIGFSAILQEDYAAQLDTEAKRITDIIIANTKKMGQLIDDLLTFSRMGRQEILKTAINTNKMVRETIDDLAKNDIYSGSITWNIHELPPMMGDINIMRQVWINLISNAVKYSGKRSERNIEIGFFLKNKETVFFVKDNGVGFDEKYKDKLFKVFQRLHSEDEFEGTGIGLAIVEKIISKHGGSVWAEAEKDKGACFFFSMPTA